MTSKIKTRVTLNENIADLKMMIFHPMESGLRKDAVTKTLIPRHFITTLDIALNGNPLLVTHLSRSVSRNPFLHFKIKNAKSGDTITISWKDNKGEKGNQTSLIP